MPDQVRLHDPHPHPQERPLGLFGPHSPANSDSPLSLVVRKEEQRKLLGISTGVDSPGRSSGFSDGGSYESSPNRSPAQQQSSGYDSRVTVNEREGDENKPLSLVIQKDLGSYVSHFQDPMARFSKPSHRKKSEAWSENSRGSQQPSTYARFAEVDSGNEDNEEPPLIISEPGLEEDAEEVVRIDGYGVHDFSKSRKRSLPTLPPRKIATQQLEKDIRSGSQEIYDEYSGKTAGLKIKDFAKLSKDSKTGPKEVSDDPRTTEDTEVDNMSDASSECPASISSADTWASSMLEGKPFTAGTDLVIRRISRSSNGESVYQCDFCDKLFANKYHLQSHLVTHTGERAFTCRTCNKTFGRKSTLRAHMTTHTKVSNFMCQVCEKACNDNNSLEEHMRMHTGEKPFVCTICQKAYARKSHLNVHYRVHTGERPFVCDFCNKDFTEKRFLNDHLQTAHNGLEGPLKCPNCAREFAYKTSLKQHLKKQMCERNMKRAHGNINSGGVAKQFQCPFCDKSYSWKQTLKQHVSMYHRNKVHTDEFWRYELTKNRRTVMDDKANEDMWKKQLGKHAEEAAKLKLEAEAAAAASDTGKANIDSKDTEASTPEKGTDIKESSQDDNSGWLDQINRNGISGQESNSSNPTATANSEVSTEIKLLALQSLQNSLHFMSMGISGQAQMAAMNSLQRMANLQPKGAAVSQSQPTVKLETGGPQAESYLSLLAQIAQKESEERNNNEIKTGDSNNNSIVNNNIHHDNSNKNVIQMSSLIHPKREGSNIELPALPTNEESSVKRTQMWLQQVNKYRHKQPKEELDANHEQLWEQQISRVKRNPVRSPLEPVEIVIEDDGSDVAPAVTPAPASSPPLQAPLRQHRNSMNNNNIPMNNNNSDNITVFQTKLVLTTTSHQGHAFISGQQPKSVCIAPPTVFLHPTATIHTLNLAAPPNVQLSAANDLERTSTPNTFKAPMNLEPEETGLSHPSPPQTPRPAQHNQKQQSSPASPPSPGASAKDVSMLKSLLLDRMKRKRSSSIESVELNTKKSSSASSAATSSPISIPEQPQDILRKRLLGWVDPPAPSPPPSAPSNTRSQDVGATSQQQNLPQEAKQPNQTATVFNMDLNQNEESSGTGGGRGNPQRPHMDETNREEPNVPHPKKQKEPFNYTNTSVLKHLLHRYTGMKH